MVLGEGDFVLVIREGLAGPLRDIVFAKWSVEAWIWEYVLLRMRIHPFIREAP